MSPELIAALNRLIHPEPHWHGPDFEQRTAILMDMLWKMVRKDWHGVADCAMDLRELHL